MKASKCYNRVRRVWAYIARTILIVPIPFLIASFFNAFDCHIIVLVYAVFGAIEMCFAAHEKMYGITDADY